jgi:GT2 family glycosyltransferase
MQLDASASAEAGSRGPMVDATVAIVTRDRRKIVREALQSVLRQTVRPEVLVVDDGSVDGTPEMLSREFPQVRVLREEAPRGPAAQRTALARLASGAIMFFFDDDVVLPSAETLEHTLTEFDHPRVGAVAIPYMEAHEAPRVRQRAPTEGQAFATFPFGAGSFAVRRDVFLQVGGYRPELIAQGEETDYCLRMLAAGFVTRLGGAPPILHLSSPPHDIDVKVLNGRRNDVLYAWRNVPMPYLAVRLVKILARSAALAVRYRQPLAAALGLLRGLREVARDPRQRAPVSRSVYRLAHTLKVRRSVPLRDIESKLPSPSA